MVTLVACDGSALKGDVGSTTGFTCASGFVGETYEKEVKIEEAKAGRFLGDATNNIAEITALNMALKYYYNKRNDGAFYFLVDSDYLRQSILFWFYNWKKKAMQSEDGIPRTKTGTPVKNWELLEETYNLFHKFPSRRLYKIRSHADPDRYEKDHAEFNKINRVEFSYGLWNRCRQLNESVDHVAHWCSTNHSNIPLKVTVPEH